MKPKSQDLEKITDLTLEHYNQRAEDFRVGARNHNVSQNIEALLQTIEADPPCTMLDFGNQRVRAILYRCLAVDLFTSSPQLISAR